MKGLHQILATSLLLLPALQPGGIYAAELRPPALESHDDIPTALQHVYVVGPCPRGRAAVGKALTRLGYVSEPPLALETTDSTTGDYSYTEIATAQDHASVPATALPPGLLPGAMYLVASRGRNKTAPELPALGRVAEGEERALSWRQMVGYGEAERRLLELSMDPAETLSAQAEKWVALCNFLGLGYSTVERLKLWQFP